MYPPSSGIDPLGLATASQDRILPELSTGINVLTGADTIAPIGGAAFHDNKVWVKKAG